jgi:hypothetical protein
MSLFVSAQEISKLEVFAGYELFRVSPSSRANVFVSPINVFSTNGGIGSVQYNVNSYLGLVGEFGLTRSGTFPLGASSVSADQTQFSYLFGPRMFVHATSRVVPFMEFVAGGVHNSRNYDVPNSRIDSAAVLPSGVSANTGATSTRFHATQNALAAAIGFGVNIEINRKLSVRPFEFDYVGTHLGRLSIPGVPAGINDSVWQINHQYSAGVNFRFGGKRQIDSNSH